MKDKKLRIGVVTLPLAKASVTPLTNLVEILATIATDFVLITGNEGYQKFKNDDRFRVYDVSYRIGNLLLRVMRNIYGQIKAALIVIKLREKIDYWVILGGERVILAIIIAKVLKKKVIILVLGSTIKDSAYSRDPFSPVIQVLSGIKLMLADTIIIYSPRFISDWHLEACRHKVLVAHEHYLDFTAFTETVPLSSRPPLIGYIGRLSGEKGVWNFVEALPVILNTQKNFRFFIGGDGPLNKSITEFLLANKLTDHVDKPGWISHEDLPRCLNQLHILVIPSFTEGLPNIVLEAMACGTPVLATPVGAVPDIIKDGETGFILKDNSPQCIADTVVRVLRSPQLEVVAKKGQKFVEENFVFEKTQEIWKKILQDL